MWRTVNSKQTKVCAVCRFWYDPSGSALRPKYGDIFEFDDTAKKHCSKNGNSNQPAWAQCGKFETKF